MSFVRDHPWLYGNHLQLLYNAGQKSAPKPPAAALAPGPPTMGQAANSSQAQTDALRQRRGLLSNIYAGSTDQAPVTGKTQLGT